MAATFSESFIRVARNSLPMPFTIAILLTLVTMVLALVLTGPTDDLATPYPVQILGFWEKGFWDLLSFAMQMMLMLVLGHVLALTKPVDAVIQKLVRLCTSTPKAAFVVTFSTIVVAWLNWGLGLIFGAVLARKVGESAVKNKFAINYPLIGAAGYVGLMIWHGGISGSAPIKVAEPHHFLADAMGVIPLSQTTFGPMNIVITLALLLLVPLAMLWLGKRVPQTPADELSSLLSGGTLQVVHRHASQNELTPAEKLDRSRWLAYLVAFMMLGIAAYKAMHSDGGVMLGFLTPDFINFVLFGVGLLLYGNFKDYVDAVDEAIVGAAGIMIQFPLYAGIAGVMKYSGLIAVFSGFVVNNSTPFIFPLFTFASAALVNVFVPSGGGQWAVQGPLIVDAASKMHIAFPKCVMAMAYGDQLTNMAQPFWALPLLGITRLTAQEILPFTLYIMLIGAAIIVAGLITF